MKIVFHGNNARIFSEGFERLIDGSHAVTVVTDDLRSPEDIELYRQADVIIGNRLRPGIAVSPRLRLFHVPGAGYDNVDFDVLPKGVSVCNCFGHENSIAEYVFAALLARHVPLQDADARLRNRDWKYWAGLSSGIRTELGSTSLGIIGFGHIGKALAAMAKAFGMWVAVANRSPVPAATPTVDNYYPLVDLRQFLGSADAVVNTLPVTEQTRDLIGDAEFAAMRPEAVLINVGRGPVVDQQALYNALKSQRIAGAIIDTWYRYPSPEEPDVRPGDLPFEELDNLVMTPHMSGCTRDMILRRQRTMAENIDLLAANQRLNNVVYET